MALVTIERRTPGIAVVTLNDPERLNAMSVAMGESIESAFLELAADDTLRVAVLTGAGTAFSAGGDLAMLTDHARRTRDEGFDASDEMRAFYSRFLAVLDLPVPVIAAVNGHAIGAGFCVALACDLQILNAGAKVGLNFAKLGLHPGMGGSWLLPRMAGRQRAAELLYTGRIVQGAVAHTYGIGLDAVAGDQVLPRALALADEIAASAPSVVRQIKASLAQTWDNNLEEHLGHEAAMQAINYAGPEIVEGLAAVLEKRPPTF